MCGDAGMQQPTVSTGPRARLAALGSQTDGGNRDIVAGVTDANESCKNMAHVGQAVNRLSQAVNKATTVVTV